MSLCPQCNQESPANSRFCVHCGERLPKDSSTNIGIPASSAVYEEPSSAHTSVPHVDREAISSLIHNSKQASLKAETLSREAIQAAQLIKKGQKNQLEVGLDCAQKSKDMADIACNVARSALEKARNVNDAKLIQDAEDALASAEDMRNISQNAVFAVNTARCFSDEDAGASTLESDKTEVRLSPIDSGKLISTVIDDEDEDDDDEYDDDDDDEYDDDDDDDDDEYDDDDDAPEPQKTEIGMMPISMDKKADAISSDTKTFSNDLDSFFSKDALGDLPLSATSALSDEFSVTKNSALDLDDIMKETDDLFSSQSNVKVDRSIDVAASVTPSVVEDLKSQIEAQVKAELEAKLRAEYEARLKVEAEARCEAEAKAQRVAEEKARREAEEKARREAEEKARREAEEKARREAEEKARREAEEKARREAEEKARREAEEAQIRAQIEAEMRAKFEAEYRERIEAELRARVAAEAAEAQMREELNASSQTNDENDSAKAEAEAAAKAEAEAAAKAEAEAKAKAEAEKKSDDDVSHDPSLEKSVHGMEAIEEASVSSYSDNASRPKKKKKKGSKSKAKANKNEAEQLEDKKEVSTPVVVEKKTEALDDDDDDMYVSKRDIDDDDDEKFDSESELGFFGGHMSQVLNPIDSHVQLEAQTAGSGKTKIYIAVFVVLVILIVIILSFK